jgi:integrase
MFTLMQPLKILIAELGVNQAIAQQLAGHQSLITTTTYYTQVANEAVRKAAELLPWWGPEEDMR